MSTHVVMFLIASLSLIINIFELVRDIVQKQNQPIQPAQEITNLSPTTDPSPTIDPSPTTNLSFATQSNPDIWDQIPRKIGSIRTVVYKVNKNPSSLSGIIYKKDLIIVDTLKSIVDKQILTTEGLTVFGIPTKMEWRHDVNGTIVGFGGVYEVDGLNYQYFIYRE